MKSNSKSFATLYVLVMVFTFSFHRVVKADSALRLSNITMSWSLLSKTKEISSQSNCLFAASNLIV